MNESPLIKLKGTEKKRWSFRYSAKCICSVESRVYGRSFTPKFWDPSWFLLIFSISSSLSGRLDLDAIEKDDRCRAGNMVQQKRPCSVLLFGSFWVIASLNICYAIIERCTTRFFKIMAPLFGLFLLLILLLLLLLLHRNFGFVITIMLLRF